MTSSSAPTRPPLLTDITTALEPVDDSHRESPRARAGDRLHRSAFAALGVIPDDLRGRILSRVFDLRFRSTADPWGCGHRDYEAAKRVVLVEAVPADARRVLEFGCGAGHNVADLGAHLPDARVLGVDVSSAAAEAALTRTAGIPNAVVDVTTPGWQDRALVSLGGAVDCLVLSEVLYYLGGSGGARQVARLSALMDPGASVVLVHSGRDAPALHARALSDLGARSHRSQRFVVLGGTFTVTTGEKPSRPGR